MGLEKNAVLSGSGGIQKGSFSLPYTTDFFKDNLCCFVFLSNLGTFVKRERDTFFIHAYFPMLFIYFLLLPSGIFSEVSCCFNGDVVSWLLYTRKNVSNIHSVYTRHKKGFFVAWLLFLWFSLLRNLTRYGRIKYLYGWILFYKKRL